MLSGRDFADCYGLGFATNPASLSFFRSRFASCWKSDYSHEKHHVDRTL